MKGHVGVVSDRAVATGFRLAGLDPRVADRHSASAVLRDMIQDARWAVILVQEDLVPSGLPPSTRRDRTGRPLIVLFPSPEAGRPGQDALTYVTELLRSAIGYRVRLR